MNKVILYGHAGKDPIIRLFGENNKNAKFTLATSSFRKDENGEKVQDTDWHNITCWDKLADVAEKYIKKGIGLLIEGKIKYRNYVDQAGVTKYYTEIIASGITLVGKKEEEQDKQNKQMNGKSFYPVNGKGKQPVSSMSDINELPPYVANYDEIQEENPNDLPF